MRGHVTIRFYEELNDFLPPDLRQQDFPAAFSPGDTVKALIESLGVPHTEVDLVLVNGLSVDFGRRLADGDRVSVYPVFESLEIGPAALPGSRVRPRPLREPRFLLDVHLGRLAKLLRMLGFDSAYGGAAAEDRGLARSRLERRILLTRDRGLLKRAVVSHGYCVRSSAPTRQLTEVLRRFDLWDRVRPLTLCLRCNAPLEAVPRQEAVGRVPPHVLDSYAGFSRCPQCRRLYWPGSHWENMRRFLERLAGSATP